jgi:hypothetical protein
MNPINIRIEYHSPDQAWAAVFMRHPVMPDGTTAIQSEPWYLNGALVGMGSAPSSAVEDLIEEAKFLIINGENFLTAAAISEPLNIEDRQWLAKLLAPLDVDDEMYLALRNAQ